jgi:hypothetical protein
MCAPARTVPTLRVPERRKTVRNPQIAELTAPLCSRSGPGADALQALPGSTSRHRYPPLPAAVDLGPPNCGGGSAVVRLTRGPPDRLVCTASWLVPASCQRVRPFKACTAKRPPQATTRMPRPTPCARACLCGGPGTPPVAARSQRFHAGRTWPQTTRAHHGASVRQVTGDAVALALAGVAARAEPCPVAAVNPLSRVSNHGRKAHAAGTFSNRRASSVGAAGAVRCDPERAASGTLGRFDPPPQ